MAIPTYTRNSDGTITIHVPAGTPRGRYEARSKGIPPQVTRESTRKLIGDRLRSGRTTWASGLHVRTDGQRDVEGVQAWERDLGRWSDLILGASTDTGRGWGVQGGPANNGASGLANNTWGWKGVSRGQFGSLKVMGTSIHPWTSPAMHDTAEQKALHQDIQAGKYDWAYRQLAQNLVNTGWGDCLVRINWENNGTWYGHATNRPANAADCGKAVARAASQMLDVAPGLRFSMDTSSHMGFPTGSETAQQWFDAYYPQQYAPSGKTVTHVVVSDIYFAFAERNIGSNPTYDAWNSMVYSNDQTWVTLGKACDWAKAHGLPVGIAEWGLVWPYKQDGSVDSRLGVGDAPAYVQHMHRFITEHPEIAFEGYWINSQWSNNDLITDLRTIFPNSWAAYKDLWGA